MNSWRLAEVGFFGNRWAGVLYFISVFLDACCCPADSSEQLGAVAMCDGCAKDILQSCLAALGHTVFDLSQKFINDCWIVMNHSSCGAFVLGPTLGQS